MTDEIDEEPVKHGLKERIGGIGQFVIGELEQFGGVLTGDPMTQAEGAFNQEVGELREEIKHPELSEDEE